jgi:two-component system OmpR family response regulator
MAHVLLVDDDKDLVELNRTALELGGHRVDCAFSAEEGWETVTRLSPQLVVLDVMMERFDAGFELAHRIARAHPNLPLIMLTGVDDYLSKEMRASQDHDEGWMPVHRFMEKPVSPAVLLTEVESLLHELS